MRATVLPAVRAAITPVCTLFPMSLVAAIPGPAQDALALDATALGMGFAVFFLASAVSAGLLGGRVEAWGWQRSARGLFATTVASLLALSWAPEGAAWFLAVMAVGGVPNGLSHSIANVFLDARLPDGRRALGFGVKQVAVPASLLLAGAAAPPAVTVYGWRGAATAFALATLAVAVIFPLVASTDDEPHPPQEERQHRRHPAVDMRVVAGAGLLATVMTAALSSFYASSLESKGMDLALAGAFLAVAGGASLIGRLGLGWLVDRLGVADPRRHFKIVAAALGVGSLATIGMGFAGPVVAAILGILAFGIGWGWPGLFHLAVVSQHGDTIARSTGQALAGIFFGAVVGPAVFGQLISDPPTPWAWAVVGACGGLGSALLFWGTTRARTRTTGNVRTR